MHFYLFIQVIFHYSLLQDTEFSSLCYPSLCVVVCIYWSHTSNLSPFPLPLVTISLLFYVNEAVSFFVYSFICITSLGSTYKQYIIFVFLYLIAGRNINHLRYADAITLKAESKEEPKNLLMKVKEENARAGLKLSIQKMKIMASDLVTSWQTDGETMETVADFIFGRLQNHCRWWLQPWN